MAAKPHTSSSDAARAEGNPAFRMMGRSVSRVPIQNQKLKINRPAPYQELQATVSQLAHISGSHWVLDDGFAV